MLSSRVGYFRGTAEHIYLPSAMRRRLETTLENLRTDHLDIYFLRNTDFGEDDRHLGGALERERDFQRQGLLTGTYDPDHPPVFGDTRAALTRVAPQYCLRYADNIAVPVLIGYPDPSRSPRTSPPTGPDHRTAIACRTIDVQPGHRHAALSSN